MTIMYKYEKGGPFSTTLKCLEYMGQIPISMDKPCKRKFYILFMLSKFFSFFLTSVGPVLHLIMSLRNESEVDISEDISISLGGTGAGIASLLFAIKYEEWSGFFKDVTDVNQFGKPTNFEETTRRLNHFGKICCICSSSVTIVYGTAAWFNSKGCHDAESSFKQICPVFAPLWLPFGTDDMTAGVTIFIIQIVFIGVLTGQSFLITSYIMYESAEMLISHIDCLKDRFRVVFDVESMEEKKKRLKFCIKYHNHILQLGNRLNLLIKHTAGQMTLLAALVCGCVTNQMLNTKPMGSLIYLAGWSIALFGFCHAGQRIKDQTTSIAYALLDSKWYNTDAETQRDVQFILLRCQTPITLEALPLGVIDYPFFYMVRTIKTGYSYFTVLNQST